MKLNVEHIHIQKNFLFLFAQGENLFQEAFI